MNDTTFRDATERVDNGLGDGGERLHVPIFILTRGQGLPLFEGLAAKQIELYRTRVLEGENGVTHTHYRVLR